MILKSIMGIDCHTRVVVFFEVNRADAAEINEGEGIYDYLKRVAKDESKCKIVPDTKCDDDNCTPFKEIDKYTAKYISEEEKMRRREKAKKVGFENAIVVLLDETFNCEKAIPTGLFEYVNINRLKRRFGLKKTPSLGIISTANFS